MILFHLIIFHLSIVIQKNGMLDCVILGKIEYARLARNCLNDQFVKFDLPTYKH